MITVTLVAGIALVGFVNGLFSTGSGSLSNQVVANINQLGERETIVYANFGPGTACGSLTCSPTTSVWIYNNGQVNLTLSAILVSGSFEYGTGSCMASPCGLTIDIGPASSSSLASFSISGSTSCSSTSSTILSYTNGNGAGATPFPPVPGIIVHSKGTIDPSNPTEFKITLSSLNSCSPTPTSYQFVSGQSYTFLVIGAAGSQATLPNVPKSS